MKDQDGRRRYRLLPWGSGLRPSPVGTLATPPAGGNADRKLAGPAPVSDEPARLRARIASAALAFRGYDQTNLGRSADLLAHPAYSAIVAEVLAEASAVASEAVGRRIDLIQYVQAGTPSSLETFADDVALIVGMELAQLCLLEEVFEVPVATARLSLGYSIGELSAVVLGGLFTLEQILPVPLALADDCATLARDASMAVLFTRGPILPTDDVDRLCEVVRSEGRGLIGPSAYLGPNAALLIGQSGTLERLESLIPDFLPERTMLRRKEHRFPPLHSPLVWECNVPNRTAMALYRIASAPVLPRPSIISCVTGEASYDGVINRDLLVRWTDRPQRLWDAIDGVLSSGVETVVHVGPAPNLIPATFHRLGNNVLKQMGHPAVKALGRGVVAGMNRHAWLGHILPSRASLLRAPFLEHIVLEDWLLANAPG